MKTFLTYLTFAALGFAPNSFSADHAVPPASLSAQEKAAGWKLLFNGKSLEGWRGYQKPAAPTNGWVITNGCLKLVENSRGGNLITTEKFEDFEFAWEWKIPAQANNGVKYLVLEERGNAPGPEYQMIDDTIDEPPKRATASLYDILAPQPSRQQQPIGEWNESRIIVRGPKVEHWLNGKRVLQYELGSPELKEAVNQSKFKDVKGFAQKNSGHIMLTDHSSEAWYRNLKIRRLDPN